jgi:hypothetical protein
MSYSTYAQYLAHPRFRAAVAEALRRASGRCEQCQESRQTEPHHVRYCAWGQFDPPENLLMLCRSCHEDAHRCVVCGLVRLKAKQIKQNKTTCERCEPVDTQSRIR